MTRQPKATTILTDGVHLVSTKSEADLHAFAQRIGLKRIWYQDKLKSGKPSLHPHYDIITASKLRRAIAAGAQRVPSKDIIHKAWWAKPIVSQAGPPDVDATPLPLPFSEKE